MSDFGHNAMAFNSAGAYVVRVDSWGDGPFVLEAEGKSFRFEDSDRFGPYLLTKRDEIAANPYPGKYSPFWRAHRIWVRQGRRVEDAGNYWKCLWDEPKATVAKHIGGRYYMIVDHGEEDGKTEYVED